MSNAVSLAVVASLMAPAPAPAPAAGDPAPTVAAPGSSSDTVHLKSGGFVRGTVEEYEPGGTVVLRKPDGTTRTFTAEEVERIDVADQPTPQPIPEPQPEPAAKVDTPSADTATVFLVRGDRRSDQLALQRRTGGVFVSGSGGSASGFSWQNVCTAPCGRPVDTNGIFFVNGINKSPVLASKTLSLEPYRGKDVTLEVRGGSVGAFVGSVVIMTAGGSLAAVSSLWFIDDDRSNAVGGAMLAAGLAGFVGGMVMLFRSRHRVKARPGRPGPGAR